MAETSPPYSDLISAWNFGERVPTTSIPSVTSPRDALAASTATGGFPAGASFPCVASPLDEQPAPAAQSASSAAPIPYRILIVPSPFPSLPPSRGRSRRRGARASAGFPPVRRSAAAGTAPAP